MSPPVFFAGWLKVINRCFFNFVLSITCLFATAQNEDIKSLQAQLSKTNAPEQKFEILNGIIHYYMQSGKTDSMGILCQQGLQLAEQLKNDTLIVRAYKSVGSFFNLKADFSNGLEYKLRALRLAEKIKNQDELIKICNNISIDYILLSYYTEALKYLRKAQALIQKGYGDSSDPVYIYCNMGHAYEELHEPDSALVYLQLATAINLKIKYNWIQSFMLIFLAKTYEQTNDNDLAESYFKKSINFSDSLNMPPALASALKSYSQFLFRQNNYADAKHYGLQALSVCKQIGAKPFAIESADVLAKTYSQLHKTDSAYYYSSLKDAFRDSVFNQQILNHLQDLTFTEQIRENEEAAQQQELERQRNNMIQYTFIGIGLVVFVTVLLLLSRSVIVHPRWIEFLGLLGLLLVFEFINLIVHPFLSSATHESPALIFLVLVAIAAFLIPAHHYLERWIRYKLVEKNKKLHITAAHKTLAEFEENQSVEVNNETNKSEQK